MMASSVRPAIKARIGRRRLIVSNHLQRPPIDIDTYRQIAASGPDLRCSGIAHHGVARSWPIHNVLSRAALPSRCYFIRHRRNSSMPSLDESGAMWRVYSSLRVGQVRKTANNQIVGHNSCTSGKPSYRPRRRPIASRRRKSAYMPSPHLIVIRRRRTSWRFFAFSCRCS